MVYIEGDPTVACVWRRQTFSAAADSFSSEMSSVLLQDSLPELLSLLSTPFSDPSSTSTVPPALVSILDAAYSFSRMLHGSKSGAGGRLDAFYKAFVPDLGTLLDPHQVELVKRCLKAENGELDKVGACIFPGLVKVTGGEVASQTVMKRALVLCDCALGLSDHYIQETRGGYQNGYGSTPPPPPGPPGVPEQGYQDGYDNNVHNLLNPHNPASPLGSPSKPPPPPNSSSPSLASPPTTFSNMASPIAYQEQQLAAIPGLGSTAGPGMTPSGAMPNPYSRPTSSAGPEYPLQEMEGMTLVPNGNMNR